MKHNKLLLLLTATAMLASCGEGASSPKSSATPSQEPSSNTSASLPDSSTDTGVSSSSSSSSAPYVPAAADFGPLLYENGFIGPRGALWINLEETTFVDFEEEQTIYETTYAGLETYTYSVSGKSYTEELPTVYFGDSARVRLGTGNYKFAMFEKKDSAGKWASDSYFMPYTAEFSGVYNGYEEGSVDPNNVLYLISPEYDATIEGFVVKGAYRANKAYATLNWSAQTFFMKEGDQYVVAMDFLDREDGAYFENPVTVSEKGLRVVSDDESLRNDYFYADFSLLSNYLVDVEGHLLNYEYDETDGLMDWDTYESFGAAHSHHDENGFYFTFGSDTETNLTVRLNGAGIFANYGDDEIVVLAPLFTLYGSIYAGTCTMSNKDISIEFGYEFDWDTWENVFVCKVNGNAVTGSLSVANGVACLDFSYENVDYTLLRQSEYSAIVLDSEGGLSYVFDKAYLDSTFAKTFYNITNGVVTEITVNTDGTAVVAGQTINNVAYGYSSEYETIVCQLGGYSIMAIDEELGSFVMVDPTGAMAYIISGEELNKVLGNYEGSRVGGSNRVISFSLEEGLSYRGQAASALNFSFTLGEDGSIVPILTFVVGTSQYVFLPDFKGAGDIYTVSSKSGGYIFVCSCLKTEQFNDLCGDYLYYGSDDYGVEHFTYSAENGLYITTSNSSGAAELVAYPTYQFSHDSDGNLVVSIPVNAGGQTIAVPFTQTSKDTIKSPTGYVYLSAEYYAIQGVYYNADHILYVDGTSVYYDGAVYASAVAELTEQGVNLTIDSGVIASFVNGAASLKVGENEPVDLTAYDFVPAAWVGTYTCSDGKTYELKIDSVTGKLTAYIDGAFFWNNFTLVVVDGAVGVKFSALGTTLTFVYDGTNRTVTAQTSGTPVPPPPPSF